MYWLPHGGFGILRWGGHHGILINIDDINRFNFVLIIILQILHNSLAHEYVNFFTSNHKY